MDQISYCMTCKTLVDHPATPHLVLKDGFIHLEQIKYHASLCGIVGQEAKDV